MLNLMSNSEVYVICPAYNKTGGTELAHQLVFELCNQGVNANITYYDDNTVMINPAFTKYVSSFKRIGDIVDIKSNIIIVPEIRQDLLNNYLRIQKCVWWMSVDNYQKINGFKGFYNHFGFWRTLKHTLNGHIHFGGYPLNKDILHLYQSEYAHQFLVQNKVRNLHKLSDYLNQIYLNSQINYTKKNNVLYNPKKGIKFTNKLISSAPELNWIPIQNLSTDEVRKLLLQSKVYIDFGNHPGKDRFPREAAISNCCVITGLKGSASFYKDIPISDEFKFDDTDSNIPVIIKKIKSCLNDYDCEINKFTVYRESIRKEYGEFKLDVKDLITNYKNEDN